MEKILVFYTFALILVSGAWWGAAAIGSQPEPVASTAACEESCLNIERGAAHNGTAPRVRYCTKLTADGKCECDWEKVVSPAGGCVCASPVHSLDEHGRCVCDRHRCITLATVSCKQNGTTPVAVDSTGCCPPVQCPITEPVPTSRCPDDSYEPGASSSGGGSGACACYPCRRHACAAGERAVIKRRGTQRPGSCCDLYECEPRSNGSCLYEGRVIQDGDSWRHDCLIYRCDHGLAIEESADDCPTKKRCFWGGQTYEHGDTWMKDDCTNCTCVHGRSKCVAHFCGTAPASTIRPPPGCAPLVGCTRRCPFGNKLNRRGCPLCKCRPPDAKQLHHLLHALNCTPEHCELDKLRPNNCTAATVSTTAQEPYQCPKCTEASLVVDGVFVGVIVFLVAVVAALCVLLYRERRRGHCSLALQGGGAPDHKYVHIPRFDQPPSLRKAPVELKDLR